MLTFFTCLFYDISNFIDENFGSVVDRKFTINFEVLDSKQGYVRIIIRFITKIDSFTF